MVGGGASQVSPHKKGSIGNSFSQAERGWAQKCRGSFDTGA